PTFVKLGQTLSTRTDILPPDIALQLSRLQDSVPSFPAAEAIELIEAELGSSVGRVFASFDKTPIAAASIAQVHLATLHSGEEVVVKVRRPGIERSIATDLDILH